MDTLSVKRARPVVTVAWNGSAFLATLAGDAIVDSDHDYDALHERLLLRGFDAEDCDTLVATRRIIWRPRTYRAVHPADFKR